MDERHNIGTTVGPLAVRVVGEGPTAVLWPSLFMDGRSGSGSFPPWRRTGAWSSSTDRDTGGVATRAGDTPSASV